MSLAVKHPHDESSFYFFSLRIRFQKRKKRLTKDEKVHESLGSDVFDGERPLVMIDKLGAQVGARIKFVFFHPRKEFKFVVLRQVIKVIMR
jgi:hypothetical protein